MFGFFLVFLNFMMCDVLCSLWCTFVSFGVRCVMVLFVVCCVVFSC